MMLGISRRAVSIQITLWSRHLSETIDHDIAVTQQMLMPYLPAQHAIVINSQTSGLIFLWSSLIAFIYYYIVIPYFL